MKLLVALDRTSKDAEVVVPTVKLAKATGAEVVLLHVISPWVDTAFAEADTPEGRLQEVLAASHAYLGQMAAQFNGIPVTERVEALHWPPGEGSEEVAEAIARVARDFGADLVVVASKHAADVLGVIMGSTARAVLGLSPCPVVVVRPPTAALHQPCTSAT
jgi:nucleotide-binding universal stress UspA family protein